MDGCASTFASVAADALAARLGGGVAVAALARRLSRILFALWRDGTRFAPTVGA
jgi:hypothetical protein